jgi:hypothetical protein
MPWVDGGRVLFTDAASLLLWLVVLLLLAQAPRWTGALIGAVAGLAVGTLLALGGVVLDLSLPLLALGLFIGVLVAWARPWPAVLPVALATVSACGLVLMLAPSPMQALGYRLGWLAGLWITVLSLAALALMLLRLVLGPEPGPVKRLLLRVGGSWLATAALLVGVLELVRRGG